MSDPYAEDRAANAALESFYQQRADQLLADYHWTLEQREHYLNLLYHRLEKNHNRSAKQTDATWVPLKILFAPITGMFALFEIIMNAATKYDRRRR